MSKFLSRLCVPVLATFLFACATEYSVRQSNLPAPPIADQRPHSFEMHGYVVSDPWNWLKDSSYPTIDDAEVLDYLEQENRYFEAFMQPQQPLVETLLEEFKGRVQADERSVPQPDGAWSYQWEFTPGSEYRRWFRFSANGDERREQLLIDEAKRAAAHDFYRLGSYRVSPDQRLFAFSEDTSGGERYVLRIRDIESGRMLADEIHETTGTPVWSADGNTLFYVALDSQWRPYQVRAHRLGTPADEDRVVYEELDPGFFVSLDRTQSRRYILINSGDHVSNEVRVLDASASQSTPQLIAERRAGHEYFVDHAEGHFYIRSNDTHANFRIVRAAEKTPQPQHWQELIAASDQHYLRGLTAYRDFLVISERREGLDQIRIRHHDGEEHYVQFPESLYRVNPGSNLEYAPEMIRLRYESMLTPLTVFDYDPENRTLITRKVRAIPSGYDPQRYRSERLWAPARDGVQVPVSVLYPRDYPRDGSGRLYLVAYGAYGNAFDPNFDQRRLSLLERGFAVAIAHVRGGDELGRAWYEAGKREHRVNTFHDFIDVARYLIDKGFAREGQISIAGGSAGGELVGYVLNAEPQLWRAAIAAVPFVDVLNTMLDTSLPLTPMEWPEWGNPITDKQAFELIRSYSPYDNVRAQDYPALMITAGLHDPRVTYWEPAKWAARLRATKTDHNPLVLKTNMGAGHQGSSGRFSALREAAEMYAFILAAFDSTEGAP